MSEVRIVATGLGFPEGPVVMPDGSVILTEIRNGRCSRITPDGKVSLFSATGGGPNGLAVGPDGALYLLQQRRQPLRRGRVDGPGAASRLQVRFHPAARSCDRHGQNALHRLRRPQAEGPERPGVRQGGRHVFHRPGQTLRPPSRSWRRLLCPAGRIKDRLPRLPHAEPERLRPLTRRQGALCGGYRRRAAVGVRCRRAGRAAQAQRLTRRMAGGTSPDWAAALVSTAWR